MQHSAGSTRDPMRTSTPRSGRPSSARRTDSGSSRVAAGAHRRLRRAVGAQHDDAELVLGAGEDARVEHRPAEVHRGEWYLREAPTFRFVEHAVEQEIWTAEERARPSPSGGRSVATSSKRDSSVACPPRVGAIVIACSIPVTDASGLIMKMLSAAVRRAASMKLRDATSIVLSECTTPFGREVVPDVKITIDGSSGSRPGEGGDEVAGPGTAPPTVSIASQRTASRRDRRGRTPAARARPTARLRATMSRTWAAPALVGATITSAPSRSTACTATTETMSLAVSTKTASSAVTPSRSNAATAPSIAASSSPYVSARPRSASAIRAGSRRAASRTRSTGSVLQCPAVRNRAARVAARAAA